MAKSSKKLGQLNIDLETKKYSQPSEGALDPNFLVKSKMIDGNMYFAKIVDCRLKKVLDPKKKRNCNSYEYYLHFINFDRRMDEWVPGEKLEITRELSDEENLIRKKILTHDDKSHEGLDPAYLAAHEKATRFKTIGKIQLGNYQSETWYYSPYPQGYQDIPCLYICEYCLSFYAEATELARHLVRCGIRHPPGDEIYRHRDSKSGVEHSMYEVDGFKNTVYCENIAYLSKLFLDHKNFYEDITPFLFYVLTENDEQGSHMVGYFSKEKESNKQWNLSCIEVLPFHQRKGYGKFLITFSYELSIIEKKPGGPETPLSDLGRASYISWWSQRIIDYIRAHKGEQFSISDITKETCILEKDIMETLEEIGMLKVEGNQFKICTDETFMADLYKKAGKPGLECAPEKITWYPFKFKFNNTS